MPNRPSKGGGGRRSSGDNQLGAAIFGAPALNAEFGQDPETAEGRPLSKYGADRLYQDPTLMQRIFNRRGVEAANEQQRAYDVNQIISKQDAARQLANSLAIQKGGFDNSMALAKFNQGAGQAEFDRQHAATRQAEQQKSFEVAQQKNIEDADRGMIFGTEHRALLPQGVDVNDNVQMGRLAKLIMGTEMANSGTMSMLSKNAKINADASGSNLLQAQNELGLGSITQPGYAGEFNTGVLDTAKYGNAKVADRMALLKEFGPDMRASEAGAARKGAMFSVSPGEFAKSLAPYSTVMLEGGRNIKTPTTKNIGGMEVPGEPIDVWKSATSGGEFGVTPEIKAARVAAAIAAGNAPVAGQPASKASNVYEDELAALTNDKTLEAGRAGVSDIVSQLRNINTQIKAGGSMVPSGTSNAYGAAAPEIWQAMPEQQKIQLLTQAAQLEKQRSAALGKLQGRRPLSKQ